MNQPSHDEYVYKYSGGLGTYCAKHQPFAVYREEVDKTFFCYGGTSDGSNSELLHMVSYYDHERDVVPKPTVLLDKQTSDAHDNPVIAVDDAGYVWVFSTSHGRSSPSFIHHSREPYEIDAFDRVNARRRTEAGYEPITNFSYMQAWHVSGRGFFCFFTRYKYPAARTICAMNSEDGVTWSEWTRLAAIEEGHYQVSAADERRAASAFNYHPKGEGLNWRTNLYYLETRDFGESWRTAAGEEVAVPLTDPDNQALVHDYCAEGWNVYLKDITFDADGRPVILFITSKGYESGPENDPRTWTTARWTGEAWELRAAMTSDNNYDMGSLYLEQDGSWLIIGPTETGPQPYNPGGEMALWRSEDRGGTWDRVRTLTGESERNHTYARRPVDPHPRFYPLWADGHGRRPSTSDLFFCDREGSVRLLPREMEGDILRPSRFDG